MSSHSSTSPDMISSLTATAYAPVLIEACGGREQIAGLLAGMQFTDDVHWREVYERNGELRNYQIGHQQAGKWHVENDRLCRAFPSENAGDCFDVWKDGNTLKTRRDVEDRHPIMGIVENPTDPSTTAMNK